MLQEDLVGLCLWSVVARVWVFGSQNPRFCSYSAIGAENSPSYVKVPITQVGLLMINHIIILFIAVLERSHIVEYVAIFNYEKKTNIDQDINNFMYSRLPMIAEKCRICPEKTGDSALTKTIVVAGWRVDGGWKLGCLIRTDIKWLRA